MSVLRPSTTIIGKSHVQADSVATRSLVARNIASDSLTVGGVVVTGGGGGGGPLLTDIASIEFKQADNADYATAACNNIVIGTATSVASYPIGGMPTIDPGVEAPGFNNVLIGAVISSGYYNNVCIGQAVGRNETFTGNSGYNISIGAYCRAASLPAVRYNEAGNITIGKRCNYNGTMFNNNILLGPSCAENCNIGGNNILLGNSAGAVGNMGDNNIVIGTQAQVGATQVNFPIVIGHTAQCNANETIAIGHSSNSAHVYSIALGTLATTSATNQLAINISGGATNTLRTDLLATDAAMAAGSLAVPNATKTLSVFLNGTEYLIPLFVPA
jgi:hypothetical protein